MSRKINFREYLILANGNQMEDQGKSIIFHLTGLPQFTTFPQLYMDVAESTKFQEVKSSLLTISKPTYLT